MCRAVQERAQGRRTRGSVWALGGLGVHDAGEGAHDSCAGTACARRGVTWRA